SDLKRHLKGSNQSVSKLPPTIINLYRREWFLLKWSEMCIHTTNEAVEPISNILHNNGANGIVIEDPLDLVKERDTFFGEVYELNPAEYPEDGIFIKAYLPIDEFLNKTIGVIKDSINELPSYNIDIGQNNITFSEVSEI